MTGAGYFDGLDIAVDAALYPSTAVQPQMFDDVPGRELGTIEQQYIDLLRLCKAQTVFVRTLQRTYYAGDKTVLRQCKTEELKLDKITAHIAIFEAKHLG